MIKQTTTLIALISAGSLLAAAYGCSSSTTVTSTDAGTSPDTGVSTTPLDSSTGTPDTGSTGHDSGGTTSNDSGGGSNDAGEDAGPTCPGTVAASQIPSAAAALGTTATPGSCTAAQITAFVEDCFGSALPDGGSAPATACQDFQSDSANATCLKCAAPNNGQTLITGGPILATAGGGAYANTPGCLVLTGGTAATQCATDYANELQCGDLACSSCDDVTSQGPDWQTCEQNQPSASCTSYATAAQTDCATELADGGPGVECEDPNFVITVYCGGGDAGADDGG